MAYFRRTIINGQPPIPPTPPYVPPTPPTPPTPEGGTTPVTPRPTHEGNTTLKCYYNKSDVNVLNKSLQLLVDIDNVSYKENVSIINPVVVIYSTHDLTNCNYCYIDTFQRYYYIVDKICTRPNYYTLTLRVDVLMSYKDQIKNLWGIVNRVAPTEENHNPYFMSEHYYLESEQLTFIDGGENKKGILEPNSGQWILATVGKTDYEEQ